MSFVSKAYTALLLLSSLLALSLVHSAPIESPLRIRLNQNLLKTMFNKNDDQLLELFKNVSLSPAAEEGSKLQIKAFTVSLEANSEKFDFDISLD
jgi:hypothetical protein